MTAATHKQYSISFGLCASMILFAKGLTDINYYLSLPIILMASKAGALFPDVDHVWKNVKEKTAVNFLINKIIHLTGGKHRSWQTHSIDIVVWLTAAAMVVPDILFTNSIIDNVNREVLSVISLGFMSGWLSHIVADMMNGVGVRMFCFSRQTVAFVPTHIGKLRFNTGNGWELFCYKSTRVINIVLGIIAIIFPFILDGKIKLLSHLIGG